MSTNVPQDGGGFGFPISFTHDDLVSIGCNGRTGKANMTHIRLLLGPKVMRIILPTYHNVPPEHLDHKLRTTEMLRISLHGSNQKHTGPLIEVLYRFTDVKARGSFRHVFHFVSEGGGLTGKLYTQTRRYIAK